MVTIVLTVSRKHFLKRLFDSLQDLKCNVEDTALLVYVDGDYALYEKVMSFVGNTKFISKYCVYGTRKAPADVSSMVRRRRRIGEIHNEIKTQLMDWPQIPELVYIIEDDTIVPANSLELLLESYKTVGDNVGFVTGVELGRWGYPHIGGWIVDNLQEPTHIESVPVAEGLQELHAAGLYCCLVSLKNYNAGDFYPFQDILGPDVTFGLSLAKRGLKNYIDHRVKCIHMTQTEDISVENSVIVQVKFDKMATERFGWKLSQK